MKQTGGLTRRLGFTPAALRLTLPEVGGAHGGGNSQVFDFSGKHLCKIDSVAATVAKPESEVCQLLRLFITTCWTSFTALRLKPNTQMRPNAPPIDIGKHINCVYSLFADTGTDNAAAGTKTNVLEQIFLNQRGVSVRVKKMDGPRSLQRMDFLPAGRSRRTLSFYNPHIYAQQLKLFSHISYTCLHLCWNPQTGLGQEVLGGTLAGRGDKINTFNPSETALSRRHLSSFSCFRVISRTSLFASR